MRPVELQDTLGKTPAVEKIAQTQKANPDNEQRQAAISAETKSKEQVRQTPESPRSDEVILHREDDKDKDRGQGRKHKDTTKPDDEPEPDQDPNRPAGPPSLDITV